MAFVVLENAIVLSVTGKDAQRYLHARLSNDIKKLSAGKHCLAAALSPQGKADAYFTVYCISSTEYMLYADAGDRDLVTAALRRFIVADKIDVQDSSALFSIVRIVNSSEQNICPILAEGQLFLKQDHCYDLVTSHRDKDSLLSKLSAQAEQHLSQDAYTLQRIKLNFPTFPTEINSQTILLEAASHNSYSLNKGCYCGQEVLAKIDALGKAPRLLFRLTATTALPEGAAVSTTSDQNSVVGKIITSVYDAVENKSYAFALLKNRDFAADCQLFVEGLQAELIS